MDSVRSVLTNFSDTIGIFNTSCRSHEGYSGRRAVIKSLRVRAGGVSSGDCDCVDSGCPARVSNCDGELYLVIGITRVVELLRATTNAIGSHGRRVGKSHSMSTYCIFVSSAHIDSTRSRSVLNHVCVGA